ncbi:MAG: ABC transporter substrate-binding protein [Spirochaetes bacterium]|nr:MAG: ABC transporter substrate-binding protein [Spirochaetota bacterium]
MKSFLKFTFFVLITFTLLTTAFSEGTKEKAAEEKVIRIGCAVSLTGRVAPEGKMVKQGVEVWEKYVNEQGGINVGGENYSVKVIFYDDKSDSGTGAKLTEKLITEDKVHFLFGPFSSGITFATTAIGEKYGVITIAPEANATQVYERGYKYVFSILPPAPTLMQPILDMVSELDLFPKPKTVAIIVANDLFPISCAEGARDRAEELGLDVVLYEKYPAEATDVTSLLTMVKERNPDILLNAGYTKDALMVVRQARQVGLNVKLMGHSVGVMLPEFIESLGADANYNVEGEWWLPTLEDTGPVFGTTQDYVEMFKEMHGKEPDYHASSGTAAGVVLQLAIEEAGTLDTNKVREALLAMDVELAVWPGIKFNEKGQNVKWEHPVIQVQDQEFKVVWPSLNPLQYPMPAWSER